jgi:PEP-CTERM motif
MNFGGMFRVGMTLVMSAPIFAGTIIDTGPATNAIGIASRPDTTSFEIEAADDFVISNGGNGAFLTGGTFTGLITSTTGLSAPTGIVLEVYRVFPLDSDTVRMPNVPTRANSPSDVAFTSFDSSLGEFTFSSQTLSAAFAVLNSIQPGGIHPSPGQHTGGDGALTGQEVQFSFTLAPGTFLPDGHYFFVPQVDVSNGGQFYWLSGQRPVAGFFPPGVTDLQAWTRDQFLDPDWLRVGADIVGGSPAPAFNAAFSLQADFVPEPSTFGLCFAALGAAGWFVRKRRG